MHGIGVLGSPRSAGLQYREGVISREQSWDHQHGRVYADAFQVDVPIGDGDSGAPVVATTPGGRLRVIGVIVAAMPRSPRLGRAVSSRRVHALLDRTP